MQHDKELQKRLSVGLRVWALEGEDYHGSL